MGPNDTTARRRSLSSVVLPYLRIMRIDHWFKNVFVLPGVVVALSAQDTVEWSGFVGHLVVGMIAVCLVASSNYVINEVLDAPSDLHHPIKRHRPVPSGQIRIPIAIVQWLVLMVVGVGLGLTVNWQLSATLLALWVAGCAYNIRPLRTKDVPYLDVLTESINNPLRMLVGWYIVATTPVPPVSLLVSYWMIGCYFMALKRFAEYRDMSDDRAAHVRYRKSFAHYDEPRLLVSIMFYASTAMLFFGAFAVRYRIELIIAFPLVALTMAIYLKLAFLPSSPVEHPEKLYRQKWLMIIVTATAALLVLLLFVNVDVLERFFPRSDWTS